VERGTKLVGAVVAGITTAGLGLILRGRQDLKALQATRNEVLGHLARLGLRDVRLGETGLDAASLRALDFSSSEALRASLVTPMSSREMRKALERVLTGLRSGRWRLLSPRGAEPVLLVEGDDLYDRPLPSALQPGVRDLSGPGGGRAVRRNPDPPDMAQRWRLILGPAAGGKLPLGGQQGPGPSKGGRKQGREEGPPDRPEPGGERPSGPSAKEIDEALETAYGPGSLDPSDPKVSTWIGDVRRYWDEDVVAMIEQDVIERKGLDRMLLEKETLERITPTPELVATLIALKDKVPDETRETARMVVRKVCDEIMRVLKVAMEQAVRGAILRQRHQPLPSLQGIDWKRTIDTNLKTWDTDRQRLVPERMRFFSRQARRKLWHVIVAMDESGSMAESVVYASVMACIFASLPAIKTSVVAFDTEVVDLSNLTDDPVDLLFGTQLGGGTYIAKALEYCAGLVEQPEKTLLILISDLMENESSRQGVTARMKDLVDRGVRVLCLIGLSKSGTPAYDEEQAKQLRAIGVPVFACTPDMLPRVVEVALGGGDVSFVLAEMQASGVKIL